MLSEHADVSHYYFVSSVPQDEPTQIGGMIFPILAMRNQGWHRQLRWGSQIGSSYTRCQAVSKKVCSYSFKTRQPLRSPEATAGGQTEGRTPGMKCYRLTDLGLVQRLLDPLALQEADSASLLLETLTSGPSPKPCPLILIPVFASQETP